MKLTAKVTEVHSGTSYVDGQQRVKLYIPDADDGYKRISIPNIDEFALDDELEVYITRKPPTTAVGESVLAQVLQSAGASPEVATNITAKVTDTRSN